MNKRIKNILRCYAAGMGIKETASTFHTSRNTVRKYVRLFLSSGKSIDQLLSLSEEQLHEMFGGTESRRREPSSKRIELEALLPGYVSRLTRKGMSVRKLFKEYHSEYPDGLQLSSFKRAVRQYKFHIKVVGHVEHYAADQMYVDFAGDRLEVVDEMTGETKKAEVFVAILPFSHYTYCEAVWSQRKEDLIKGCENAMLYFEGAPAAIVPDNLKAAVTRSDRNEPVINDDFAAFAEHYGYAVCPARVRHPKDKVLVENAVKLLCRSVYPDMEGMTFSGPDSLNAAIHVSLHDFNEKVMAGREASRKEMSLRSEKDCLRSLPPKRYVETSAKLLIQFVFLKYFLYLYRMKQKLSSPSFADLFLGQRKVKQTFFSQINTVIDWAPIRAIIEVAYTKGYKSTGRPSYDSLVLFKIELLRTWYGLSDGEVEDQVNDRLSFSRFAGLGMEDIVPDSTTVCRFRNILVEADLYDTLLAEFNRQLEAKGIIVKRGAIVDASITNTPHRPRGHKSYEVVEDRKEDENIEASEKAMLKEVVKPNVDTEARWVKKMGKLHFGYKRHTVTDENGMVLAEETTAANESDMKHLETPLKKAELPWRALVYANKGCTLSNKSA